MDRRNMVSIVQKIRQGIIPRNRIYKRFLRVRVIDQNFRPVVLILKLHVFRKQRFRIQLFRAGHRRTVNRIKMTGQILIVLQLLPVDGPLNLRFMRFFRRGILILFNQLSIFIYHVLIFCLLFQKHLIRFRVLNFRLADFICFYIVSKGRHLHRLPGHPLTDRSFRLIVHPDKGREIHCLRPFLNSPPHFCPDKLCRTFITSQNNISAKHTHHTSDQEMPKVYVSTQMPHSTFLPYQDFHVLTLYAFFFVIMCLSCHFATLLIPGE